MGLVIDWMEIGKIKKLKGNSSILINPHNSNFLMILEVIAQFDPFLANHLTKYSNPGKDHTNYISYSTYEQFMLHLVKEPCWKINKKLKMLSTFLLV